MPEDELPAHSCRANPLTLPGRLEERAERQVLQQQLKAQAAESVEAHAHWDCERLAMQHVPLQARPVVP